MKPKAFEGKRALV